MRGHTPIVQIINFMNLPGRKRTSNAMTNHSDVKTEKKKKEKTINTKQQVLA